MKLAREEYVKFEDLSESNFVREYDESLEKALKRIGNVIRLGCGEGR